LRAFLSAIDQGLQTASKVHGVFKQYEPTIVEYFVKLLPPQSP